MKRDGAFSIWLRGNIWVDANTYLLRRTEGEPAKAPSWWVRDVRIALRYGNIGGMWLQTASEATARVRILGPCTLVSRDVKYKITEPVADGSSIQANFLEPMLAGLFAIADSKGSEVNRSEGRINMELDKALGFAVILGWDDLKKVSDPCSARVEYRR